MMFHFLEAEDRNNIPESQKGGQRDNARRFIRLLLCRQRRGQNVSDALSTTECNSRPLDLRFAAAICTSSHPRPIPSSSPWDVAQPSELHFLKTREPPLSEPELEIQSVTRMSDRRYGYWYPQNQGYYNGPPPVMAPPQYAPPPRRPTGFLEGCLAALCCCCLVDECCCDPSIILVT